MAFSLKDVRLTTRRASGAAEDDLPAVYPRLLRDKSTLPKIGIAIGYFDSMVGTERQVLEPELLVQFFGDHKLARCMVSCLARSYRYRSPQISEVVTSAALRRLQQKGLDSPKQLRLALYDRVNRDQDGFLRLVEREPSFARMERSLGLRANELDRLLFLDAEEHAVLVRYGEAPRPQDVVAQYNFGVLDTLLRQAEQVDLAIAGLTPADVAAVRALCAKNDVDSEVKHGTRATLLRLRGRQDAMGLWSRHGRKLTRTVAQVIERSGPEILDAAACVALRDERARLHLTPELLGMLGNTARPAIGWEGVLDTAERDSKPAAIGRIPGFTVRRLPEAQAWESGVIVPDLLLESAQSRAYLVEVRSPAHGQRLTAIYRGIGTPEAYLFTGDADFIEPLRRTGARVLAGSTPFADAHDIARILTEPVASHTATALAA